eukprot:scaffold42408_cov19-Tisochrysis_lutea.AAC.1
MARPALCVAEQSRPSRAQEHKAMDSVASIASTLIFCCHWSTSYHQSLNTSREKKLARLHTATSTAFRLKMGSSAKA